MVIGILITFAGICIAIDYFVKKNKKDTANV